MEFLDKNNLLTGLGLGLVTPIIGFGVVYAIFGLLVTAGIMDPVSSDDEKRMRTMLIFAVCANIYWVRKYNQPYTLNTLRGVVIATMLYSAAWFTYFYQSLYAEG